MGVPICEPHNGPDCPLCGGQVLAVQECTEYWSFGFDEYGQIELDDITESSTYADIKFVCGNCNTDMVITEEGITPA